MATLTFTIDMDRLTLDDLIMLEDAEQTSAHAIRDLLARFACDEGGACLPYEAAIELVGGLTIRELTDVMKKLTDSVQNVISPEMSGG